MPRPKRPLPPLNLEAAAWAAGRRNIAGVDEAGRGPLAGPVVAAAVWIDRSFLESSDISVLAGLDDSKAVPAPLRSRLFEILTNHPRIRCGVGQATVSEIDELNILRATHLAMARAVASLGDGVDFLLVDGRPVRGLPLPSKAVVGGDAASLLIAAASIVAKVERDRMMDELDRAHPGYGFGSNRGYGTGEHLEALGRLGPSPCHRRSFEPVRQLSLRFP